MIRRTSTIHKLSAWIVALLPIITGCDDVRRHQATDAVSVAPVTASLPGDAPPADVAMAMLDAIGKAHHARSEGLGIPENREQYDAALATIWSLSDRDGVYQRLIDNSPRQIPVTVSQDAALTGVSESWLSMLAHYADGLDRDTLHGSQSEDGKLARVAIQARNPDEAERLAQIEASPDITGAKGPDGQPLVPGTKPYFDLLRSKTLAEHPPFNVPIETEINLELHRTEEGWRVTRIAIDPVMLKRSASTQPPTVPAS